MSARLDDETRRRRRLKDGELADEVGELKAMAAELRDREERLKAEAVRRDLLEADGKLFRITLTPPGEVLRFSLEALRADKGDRFVEKYYRIGAVGWILRCTARRCAPGQPAA